MTKQLVPHNSSLTTESPDIKKKLFFLALMAIIPGMMMVILDSTAMNVAIPNLSLEFGVSFDHLQWVIIGYMLAMSVTIPLAGWFSDRVGAANAYMITVLLFLIGSVLCAVAQNANQLIAFRIIQGLGGGMIQPMGMAMVFRLAPPNKKGQIMGWLGIPMLIAPASGPILSGWILESSSWQWIFWINVPIGLITIGLGMRFLRKLELLQTTATEKMPLDILGLILAPTAFVLLTLSFNLSATWMTWVVGFFGLVLLLWLWFHELQHPNPLLELRAFRSAQFRRGIFVSWIQYTALNGSLIFIPQYLQNSMSYSPFDAGLVMSMLAITSGLLMPLGGKIFDHFGIRPLASSGLAIIAIALLLLSRIDESIGGVFIGGIVGLLGTGMGLCMMSLNTYILQSAPPESIHRVTPLTSAAANIIISLAILSLSQFHAVRVTTRTVETGINTPAIGLAGAYSDTFLLAAGVALVGALFSLFLKRGR